MDAFGRRQDAGNRVESHGAEWTCLIEAHFQQEVIYKPLWRTALKYAATLQEKNAGVNPILIRVEAKSGHGASNTAKKIEITADIYAFLFHALGATPNYNEASGAK
jgi:hypothetical protein